MWINGHHELYLLSACLGPSSHYRIEKHNCIVSFFGSSRAIVLVDLHSHIIDGGYYPSAWQPI